MAVDEPLNLLLVPFAAVDVEPIARIERCPPCAALAQCVTRLARRVLENVGIGVDQARAFAVLSQFDDINLGPFRWGVSISPKRRCHAGVPGSGLDSGFKVAVEYWVGASLDNARGVEQRLAGTLVDLISDRQLEVPVFKTCIRGLPRPNTPVDNVTTPLVLIELLANELIRVVCEEDPIRRCARKRLVRLTRTDGRGNERQRRHDQLERSTYGGTIH